MPHISRQKPDKKLLDSLFIELVKIVAPHNTNDATKIMSDLLTQTEKIMLAKRLAAIMMIDDGQSMYKIATKLKMSTSTVKRMYASTKNAEYYDLLNILRNRKKERERFWELIETISRLGMPSMGKDRWNALK